MTWAWSQTVGDAGAKAVLVALANFADEDGRCWPGVARLAHMTDQGERTVRRHLATLIEGSFIRREPRYVKTTGARDRDAFVFLAPPEQLAKTRGPQRSTTPGQNDRSGQSGRVPRPKPPVTLTTPPVNGASPPGQSGITPRPTVAGHKDDPSKNPQSTRAREGSSAEADMVAGGEGHTGVASETGAAAASSLWAEHLSALRQRVGEANYRAWIKNLQPMGLSAQAIRLAAPNAFQADHCRNHFAVVIEKLFERGVEIVVERR